MGLVATIVNHFRWIFWKYSDTGDGINQPTMVSIEKENASPESDRHLWRFMVHIKSNRTH